MKPPPRERTKREPDFKSGTVRRSGPQAAAWRRTELIKLLGALKRLKRTAGGNADIDYSVLRRSVPTRSTSEVQSVVESLRDKVISRASYELKRKTWKENNTRKPIEVWTHMASAVAGTLVEPISIAFSQMLLVSSVEPRTLKNSDPPRIDRPPTDTHRPVGRTIPYRPMPRLLNQDKNPENNTAPPLQFVQTPAASKGLVGGGPNRNIPAPQLQISTTFQPAATSISQPAASSSNSTTTSSSRRIALSSSATSLTTVLSTTPPSAASFCPAASSHSTPLLSTPAAAVHAGFGRTGKHATKDSPRLFGMKCIVDFERIYRYLSAIHKQNEECHLTPMESAIVLDLLMSLPEELPLLNCSQLHKHLLEVYQCLSSPANSKVSREMFKKLKDGPGQTPSTGSDRQQNAAGTAHSSDVTDSGKNTLQPDEAQSQPLGNNNPSSHSEDTMEPCLPLNPFLIPLKLLMRR